MSSDNAKKIPPLFAVPDLDGEAGVPPPKKTARRPAPEPTRSPRLPEENGVTR